MSIKQKTVTSIIWTFTDTFIVKGLTFITMLLIARWIGPTEFGLIGMMALFRAIGISLIDSGLSASIIRTPKTCDKDYSTVFYLNVIMSIIIYSLLYMCAPYIADFYNQNVLTLLVRVYCLSFLVSALSSIQISILTKEMKFKKLTYLNAPSVIIGSGVGLLLGYYGYGVWSVIVMYLVTQILYTILLWITSSWKPSFTFSTEKLKEHLNFGYKLTLSGLLDVSYKNVYNILIGKFFPINMLGYFERAKQLNDYPALTITGVVSKVSYPLLSNIQDDKERLSKVYKQLLRVSFFIISPVMLGAAALADPLFDIILGKEWIEAVPYFRILSLGAILYPIHAFNINVLKVYGRSDIFLKLEVIKKIVALICVFIGFQFGILGLVWSSVIASFFSLFINTYYSSRMINYSFLNQMKDLFPIFLSALFLFVCMYYIQLQMISYSNIIKLVIVSLIGAFVYGSIHYFSKSDTLQQLLSLLKIKL